MFKALAIVLAMCMIIPLSLAGCASNGKTLVSLDDYKISTNIYQLMLTQQKGKMASYIYSQYRDYNSETFWGTTMDMATQMTYEEYYNDAILEKAKNFVCALKLYDELKAEKSDFKMPASYTENIKAAIDDFIEYDGEGSKSKFNAVLSAYGINVKMLEEFLIMEAKAAYVVDYLYGTDGSKIDDAVKDEYFNNNYVACKQILIQKFYYLYEKDEHGNEIYFDSDGNILYDTSRVPAINSDGTAKLDEKGNQVYINDDGSIAYDTVNGIRRNQTDSATGEPMYKMYTQEEIDELGEKVLAILAEADEKGVNGFDLLRKQYSEDYDAADETKGVMYYAKDVQYSSFTSDYIDKIVSSLKGMEVGDVKYLESDLSYNIIIKTELERGAYNEEKYKGYFTDETYGVFDFIYNLKSQLYGIRLAKYASDVKVDKNALEKSGLTIKTVEPNYNFPDADIAYHFYDQYN